MKTGPEQGFRADAAKAWRDDEDSRRRQLREDAHRSLAENWPRGIALSEYLSTFTGAARPR